MKILDWLVGYRTEWLRPDIIAGLITATVVIPQAMAYATVAGLPVQAGLYTAFVPAVIYAVLGSSRGLSVSTTSTIGILTGTSLALVVPDGDPAMLLRASASLALMVGILLTLASVLRLGFLANVHLRARAGGLQGGYRRRHHPRSGAEAARCALPQGYVPAESSEPAAEPAGYVRRDARTGSRDDRVAASASSDSCRACPRRW